MSSAKALAVQEKLHACGAGVAAGAHTADPSDAGNRALTIDAGQVYKALLGHEFWYETSAKGANLDLFLWCLLLRRKGLSKMMWARMEMPVPPCSSPDHTSHSPPIPLPLTFPSRSLPAPFPLPSRSAPAPLPPPSLPPHPPLIPPFLAFPLSCSEVSSGGVEGAGARVVAGGDATPAVGQDHGPQAARARAAPQGRRRVRGGPAPLLPLLHLLAPASSSSRTPLCVCGFTIAAMPGHSHAAAATARWQQLRSRRSSAVWTNDAADALRRHGGARDHGAPERPLERCAAATQARGLALRPKVTLACARWQG
eukprot:188275-Rhodomonas_salina.3